MAVRMHGFDVTHPSREYGCGLRPLSAVPLLPLRVSRARQHPSKQQLYT